MLSPTQKMVLIPVVLASLMAGGVEGVLTATWQIENQARMVTIGVEAYWDITATMICDKIDWGSLKPGESKTITVYIKNTGGDSITGTLSTSSFDPPAAANYLTLTWDFGSTPLLASRVRETHFTLKVSPSITGITTFAFLIIVTATQYVSP